MKDFRFTESKFLQIRLESSNFFNHPLFQLDANAQNIQRSEFGYFQSQLNAPRNDAVRRPVRLLTRGIA